MTFLKNSYLVVVALVLACLTANGGARTINTGNMDNVQFGKHFVELAHGLSQVANIIQPLQETASHRRILAEETLSTEFTVMRKDPSVYFANVFSMSGDQLNQPIEVWTHPSSGVSDPALMGGSLQPFDSIEEAEDTPLQLVVKMKDTADFGGKFLYIRFINSEKVVQSSNTPIYFYDKSYSGMLSLSLGMAIVYMIASCCCWVFGARQFYHLIRISQLLYMINLLATQPKPASAYGILENFRWNIFNIIPNPVKIHEREAIQCRPAYVFWAEGMSCHAYNTLKNYVLGFIIYLILYGFILTNKYQHTPFWSNLKATMRFTVFMLTIMPDVIIAIYINATAQLSNSVLSLGFLFCFILILWYGYLITRYLGLYRTKSPEIINFMSHYVFSRSNLTMKDSKLGLKVLAVTLDNIKILVITTMIALFNNSPKTQMVIIFIMYILNALFLIIVRPYTSLFHNLFFGVSDLAFFVLVLTMYIYHITFDKINATKRENTYGGTMVAMVWIIFILNLIVYILPVMKGQDKRDVLPERGDTEKDDDKVNLRRGNTFKLKDEPLHSQANLVQKVGQSEDRLAGNSTPPKEASRVKLPEKRGVETADGSKRRLIHNSGPTDSGKEEQMPFKPKSSENPVLKNREMPHPDHVFKSPKQDPMIDGNKMGPNPTPIRSNNFVARAGNENQQSGADLRDNLPRTSQNSMAEIDPAHSHHSGDNPSLPNIHRSGKQTIKRTFKPNNLTPGDFEGM